mmetsp:Transcript_13165/g.19262  ORF Transcript_13165/g.19262 Transcript_13165/m.19262 type:complete len:82 (-) Transcript_13165:1299-1544(-)
MHESLLQEIYKQPGVKNFSRGEKRDYSFQTNVFSPFTVSRQFLPTIDESNHRAGVGDTTRIDILCTIFSHWIKTCFCKSST